MKAIAILGTYRKGKFTDQIVDEIFKPIKEANHDVEKIYLIDKQVTFCTNCRICMNEDSILQAGKCEIDDDMNELLEKIQTADILIMAAPINLGAVTAIMKRFVERFAVFAYWPWQGQIAPKPRKTPTNKKSLIITSSTMPGILLRLTAPNVLNVMKEAAKYIGFGKIYKHAFGLIGINGNFSPSKKQIQKAYNLGKKLL